MYLSRGLFLQGNLNCVRFLEVEEFHLEIRATVSQLLGSMMIIIKSIWSAVILNLILNPPINCSETSNRVKQHPFTNSIE